ncbi:histidine--tRNA ligase [Candidatus Pacearchaeota archaeon]|nr:MAG: histidine--tRNA ligase [Candidatus Pacearchaeota archaeon]
MEEIANVRGFKDFLPPDSLKRNKVKAIVERWFKLFGFQPIETPVIEFAHLAKTTDDEAVSDMYRLRDKKGRELALRYEFTFQLARIFKQNPNIKLPFKRYQIGEVFRDDPASSTRFRQFTQCDADIVGDAKLTADAECLALFVSILKELGVKPRVVVNNVNLLRSIISSVQIENVQGVMRELDKLDKLSVDEVKVNLRKYASTSQIVTLFKLLEKDLKFLRSNAFEGSEEVEELIESCEFYKFKPEFSPVLARGLSYYTGSVFEIRAPFEGKEVTIAGGGRYDDSVGKYINRKIPAVGISFGLERLALVANVSPQQIPQVLIISISQEKPSVELAMKLRKNGVSCSVSFEKPSKALEYANSLNIPVAVFVGEEEVGKKKFKYKDLSTGSEKLVSLDQLLKIVKKHKLSEG